ncbi:MAG: hypothetical protein MJ093_08780 [Saccharofermentans sp.]|nr:hypothetical protein [Saccharofermentans sp.]
MRLLFVGFIFIKKMFRDMIDSVINIRTNKLNGTFYSAFFLQLLITLVFGLVGVIAFHINGGYQGESFFTNIKTMDFDSAVEASFDEEAFSYMTEGTLMYVVGALFAFQVLVAAFASLLVHPVYVIGAVASMFGSIYCLNVYGEQAAASIILLVALFIFLALSFIGNRGGKLLLTAIFGFVNHMVLMPKFMLICQSPLNAVQVVCQSVVYMVIAVVVLMIVFAGVLGLSSGKSGVSSSESQSTSESNSEYSEDEYYGDLDRKECLKQIAEYERQVALCRESIDGRIAGTVGYGHINIDVCRREMEEFNVKIADCKKRLANLS